MSVKVLQHIALCAAVVSSGIIAGMFFAFATAVMPALRRGGDRTFVEAMNKINVDIVNGVFLLFFLGALGFGVLAALLSLPRETRPALPWIIAGTALYL